MELGITVTPKVHTVIFHVAEFCFMMSRDMALGVSRQGRVSTMIPKKRDKSIK